MNTIPTQPLGKVTLDNGYPFENSLAKCVPHRPTDGCWEWRGTTASSNGYGLLSRRLGGKKRALMAHRIAYETWVGPIPEGRVIDHLCRNHLCVNPAHLEPVTQQENVWRGEHPNMVAARSNRCRKGHEYTPSNTRISGRGTRICRRCAADRMSAKRLLERTVK